MSSDPSKVAIIIILSALAFFFLFLASAKKEGFDASGYVLNVPSNWFIKKDYKTEDWLTREYPEHIQPECLSYSLSNKYGSLENLNYLSSPTRFWRY